MKGIGYFYDPRNFWRNFFGNFFDLLGNFLVGIFWEDFIGGILWEELLSRN